MVELNVPRKRVRILQMVRRRVSQTVETNLLDVEKSGRILTLILFKRTDIEGNLVVEKTDTAAYDRAIGLSGCGNKAQTRRQIIVLSDTVAVVPQTQIEYQVGVHDPLVLNEGREFVLLAFENTVAKKNDYLSSKTTEIKDFNWRTLVSAVEISATEVHARFERVRFPRSKVEDLE